MFRNIFEGWHIVILVILVIAIFGWKRLPDAARSLGRSARILKSEVSDMKNDGTSDASGQTVRSERADAAPDQPYPTRPTDGPASYPGQESDPQVSPHRHGDGTNQGA